MSKRTDDNNLESAKALIDMYMNDEFGEEADFSNLEYVPLAYTTLLDEEDGSEFDVQVYADLINASLLVYINGKLDVIESEYYGTLSNMIPLAFVMMDFDSLVRIDNWAYAKQLANENGADKQEKKATISPIAIRSRVKQLKAMHEFMLTSNDEKLYGHWVVAGVPACPSKEDYESIASDDDAYMETSNLFRKLVSEKGWEH